KFFLTGLVLSTGLVLLAGCQTQTNESASTPPQMAEATGFSGVVYGGRQPVVGAMVVAYATATTPGAPPTQVGRDLTDSNGVFNIPSLSPAPVKGQVIYAIAVGGNAGGGNNPAIRLMTVVGVQDNLLTPVATTVNINELSTVAATAAFREHIGFQNCTAI